jgi:hypothetical protein
MNRFVGVETTRFKQLSSSGFIRWSLRQSKGILEFQEEDLILETTG